MTEILELLVRKSVRSMSFSSLLPPSYLEEAKAWLAQDCPSYDIGGFVVGEKVETATLYMKSSGVLCGLAYAEGLIEFMGLSVSWNSNYHEGDYIDVTSKVSIGVVTGKVKDILHIERTILNIISRASGVATAARESVNIAKASGWNGYVAGTRKTTPGFRNVEKYALIVGGAATHRMDLSQMVMLKDNHIWSCGSITNAVKKAKSAAGFSMKIEVECQSLEEALEACSAGSDIVMLDNMNADVLKEAAKQIKEQFPHVLIEASGGITEHTMAHYMCPQVDIISRGALTQGYPCLDFSLKINH